VHNICNINATSIETELLSRDEIDCEMGSIMSKSNYESISYPGPVTVAERSKACTVFARSEAGIMGYNPNQGFDVWCVFAFFCVCVVLCLGRGLATS
jgi:hypothetical protein